MRPQLHRIPLSYALLATVLSVYALVMLGATAAVTTSLEACGSWPLCDGRLLVPPGDPAAIGWGHRVVAGIAGLSLVFSIALAVAQADRRIQWSLVLAGGLYVLQIGIGAITALSGASVALSTLHLILAMAIFGLLILGLAWVLESDDASAAAIDESPQPVHTPIENAVTTDYPTVRDRLWAYVQLMKPRLMWLLCLVAAAGMALAAGSGLGIGTIIGTLGGGVLAIGASGTFNHVLERDVDAKMNRTADRPVTTDIIPVRHAIAFGVLLTVLSVLVFIVFTNWLATALGLTAIVFYSVIYTLILKPHTVQNTVIGGAAGALPALIGWAAVTGNIGVPALLLAAVIFAWTPAHFYNLAMVYKDDYARGGFPMLPVVYGDAVARKHILLYAGVTLLAAAALTAVSDLGWVFAVAAVAAGSGFVWMIHRLHAERTRAAAMRTFHASNAYLGVILVTLTIDALVL